MEKLEIVIGVLLLCLVALAVYAVTSWTLSRKKRRDVDVDRGKEEVPYRYLEEEAENARKKVATAYAQETMPRITITPVQPRPVFPRVRDPFSLFTASVLLACVQTSPSGWKEIGDVCTQATVLNEDRRAREIQMAKS